MNENLKVLIKNLTNHEVGFNCVNSQKTFNLAAEQVLPVKWEYIEDAAYGRGFRYLFENAYLKIMPNTENYDEVMEELQFTNLKEVSKSALSYEEVKKILKKTPLSIQYSIIKKNLREGSEATKQNFVNAALELKIRDIVVNDAILAATGIDIINTLKLNEEPKESKREE